MQEQEQDMRRELRTYLEGLVGDFAEDLPIETLLDTFNGKLNLDYLEARKYFIEHLALLDKK
jgi:hypothetical protein